jgi:hypothetical protein
VKDQVEKEEKSRLDALKIERPAPVGVAIKVLDIGRAL